MSRNKHAQHGTKSAPHTHWLTLTRHKIKKKTSKCCEGRIASTSEHNSSRIQTLKCSIFTDILGMKRVCRDKRLRSTVQQLGTKRAFRPAVKPVVNRGSTAGFVPPPVYIGIPLFVLAQGHPVISLWLGRRRCQAVVEFVESNDSFACSCFWRYAHATFLPVLVRYTALMFPSRTCLLALNSARPHPAVPPGAPTRPDRGMSGFWIRQAIHYAMPKIRTCLCLRGLPPTPIRQSPICTPSNIAISIRPSNWSLGSQGQLEKRFCSISWRNGRASCGHE